MSVKRLYVSINFENNPLEVGELVMDEKKIHFKFYPRFLDHRLSISPIKLPLNSNLYTAASIPFDGLYGVFNDSLPDGWGRLLLDRKLTAKGISPYQIGPLDRLAYVGIHGKGALTYAPAKKEENLPNSQLELDILAKEMNAVIEGTTTEILDDLFHMGGSSGGARPKIHVGFNKESHHLITNQSTLPKGYEHWLVKFPSSFDKKDIANIEYAYYLMAKDAGIKMSECRLFKGASGQQYFGTKRFDRVGNNRLHMHSAAGLMHDDYRHSQLDYGHLMDCAFRLENHVEAYRTVLRLAAFNIFSHNRDDHSKNFSFLMDAHGRWQLAPAYDLTFSTSSHGMHSTMVAGESRNPGRKQLLELAKVFSIKKPETVIDEVLESVMKWQLFADEAGVTKNTSAEINSVIRGIVK